MQCLPPGPRGEKGEEGPPAPLVSVWLPLPGDSVSEAEIEFRRPRITGAMGKPHAVGSKSAEPCRPVLCLWPVGLWGTRLGGQSSSWEPGPGRAEAAAAT